MESSPSQVQKANRLSLPGTQYCIAVGCSNSQKTHSSQGIKFHRFPAQKKRQEAWVRAVRRQNKNGSLWYPKAGARICSQHFVGGKKSNDPNSPSFILTVFPTHHIKQPKESDLQRLERRKLREEKRVCVDSERAKADEMEMEETLVREEMQENDSVEPLVPHEAPKMKPVHVSISIQTPKRLASWEWDFQWVCESFENDVLGSTKAVKDKSTMASIKKSNEKSVQTVKQSSNAEAVSKETDERDFEEIPMRSRPLPLISFPSKQFQSFTGISRNLFYFFSYKIGNKVQDSRHISRESKLLLFFVKLKLNLTWVNLAAMFDVSEKFASKIFPEALKAMHEIAKDLVVWFDRETIDARMPESFKALFKRTRVIIDASEIECSRLNSSRLRVQTYSNYKGRFTVKFLIGIAPSGDITFVSKGFGGRTTDTELTVKSGLLSLIQPNDLVLADKGFPNIDTQLQQAGRILVTPPFKTRNRQFLQEQVDFGYKVAHVRVHVERAIKRMKRFQILDFIPSHMLQYIDEILLIVAGICNCQNDLIAQE